MPLAPVRSNMSYKFETLLLVVYKIFDLLCDMNYTKIIFNFTHLGRSRLQEVTKNAKRITAITIISDGEVQITNPAHSTRLLQFQHELWPTRSYLYSESKIGYAIERKYYQEDGNSAILFPKPIYFLDDKMRKRRCYWGKIDATDGIAIIFTILFCFLSSQFPYSVCQPWLTMSLPLYHNQA